MASNHTHWRSPPYSPQHLQESRSLHVVYDFVRSRRPNQRSQTVCDPERKQIASYIAAKRLHKQLISLCDLKMWHSTGTARPASPLTAWHLLPGAMRSLLIEAGRISDHFSLPATSVTGLPTRSPRINHAHEPLITIVIHE